jgi:hypothetical protein
MIDGMDFSKVLAENYRVNLGLHMTITNMKQFFTVSLGMGLF